MYSYVWGGSTENSTQSRERGPAESFSRAAYSASICPLKGFFKNPLDKIYSYLTFSAMKLDSMALRAFNIQYFGQETSDFKSHLSFEFLHFQHSSWAGPLRGTVSLTACSKGRVSRGKCEIPMSDGKFTVRLCEPAIFKLCDRISLQKRKSSQNRFCLFIWGHVKSFKQKNNDQQSCDTIPLRY